MANCRTACALVFGLLCDLGGASAGTIPTDRIPAFAVPRMSQPPRIDGTIDPNEWREAVAISGVANQVDNLLVPRPTTFFLAWDAEHIYMAARTWVMPGYRPRVGGRAPNTGNVGDDGMELHFQPLGRNVPTGRTSSSYKFFINCLGFAGDFMRVAVGQQFKNWLPKFQIATRLTEPGSAPLGGRWWECEIAMSIQDFELSGPNRAGDTWKLMLGFNHMPIWIQARIPNTTSYFDPSGYCTGTLVENTPAVQVTMDELPGLCDGTAAVAFRAFNPTGQPVQLKVLAQIADAQGDLIKQEPTLVVEPGKTAEAKINAKLPRQPKDGSAFFHVVQGDKELFRYFTFFNVGYPEFFMKATSPKQAFPLEASFNPVQCNLFVQGDAYYLDKPDGAKALQYRILRQGSDNPVAEGKIERIVTHYFRDLLQLPALKEGSYELEATFLLADGKTIGPERVKFEKLDEAKAFADWWKAGLGNIERVIPPFEKMTQRRGTVTVWGRSYELDALGLPAAIASQQEAVLAAPARLLVTVNGREQAIGLGGRPTITESRDWRVAFEGDASGAGLVFRSRGTVEQDGLVQIELTYAPRGRDPVTVDALRIEFPTADTQADCLLCLGTGGNFSARTTAVLPRGTQGRLWSTLDTGRLGSAMSVGSFYPCVWVGNERRGLLWWGDTDRGWVPDDDVPAHEVIRNGQQVVIRNNVIGKPFRLDAPRTIVFSYMASPFRPLVRNWRTAIYSRDGTFSGGESWKYKWRRDPRTGRVIDGWNWLTPPSEDPAEWAALWAEYKKKADEQVHRDRPFCPSRSRNWMFVHTSLPLVGYGWKSPDRRVTDYFGPDWGDGECYTESNMDYYLYLIRRAIREGGLRTIYWDIFFPCLHHSIQNGAAYQLPDGRIQPGYAGFNTRRFMMRCYALMDEHGLTPGSQVSHATNDYLLVACPWMDAILDGEYHILKDESPMDWVDGYPIDRMRVMSCPHTFGTVISWMDLVQVTDKARSERIRRGETDYIRLFDSWNPPSSELPPNSVVDWGILDPRTEYLPFWRNPHVQCADKDILVSMWRLPDRILLSVFNNDAKQRRDAAIRVDLDGLGLVPKLVWQEFIGVRDLEKPPAEPPSVLDFHGRTLKVPALDPHTGRLIGIRLY